jgi:hypothetical protein
MLSVEVNIKIVNINININRDTCISNIDNTLATKKRQAITGVRQKASPVHSSITTTLMD